ncbi:MAG: DUF6499 domain-containing protein [Steroidobacteraceae bacterium]
MPDWQNPSDYSFTAKLNDSGWAWEFLRRNAQYRKDYEKVTTKLAVKASAVSHLTYGLTLDSPEADIRWDLGLHWWIFGPIRDPSCDAHPRFLTGFPLQPDSIEIGTYFSRRPDHAGLEEATTPHEIPRVQRSEFATLLFDLRKPWGAQGRRAQMIFTTRQTALSAVMKKTPPHKGSHNWPTYLRVIDAREAKQTSVQIAKVLLADKFGNKSGSDPAKKIEKYWEQAKRLRADPLSILGWSPIQSK